MVKEINIQKLQKDFESFKRNFYNTIDTINIYYYCVHSYCEGDNDFIDYSERKTLSCLYGLGEVVKKCINELEEEIKGVSESIL